jgi:hypothetical protein
LSDFIFIIIGPGNATKKLREKSGDFSKAAEDLAALAPADKLSEMAKVEFTLEKLEERYKENLK